MHASLRNVLFTFSIVIFKKDFIGINYFLINGGDVTKLSIKWKTWLSKKRKK
jgi:hypothetical protein